MAAKIKDGLFIGDWETSQSEVFINDNKISNLINLAGKEVQNVWASHGLVYLTYYWEDKPEYKLFSSHEDSVLTDIVEFIDISLTHGISVLLFSKRGTGRCVVALCVYLMMKYRWGFEKTYDFVYSKKPDIELNKGFIQQMFALDMKLLAARQRQRAQRNGQQNEFKIEANMTINDIAAMLPDPEAKRWNAWDPSYLLSRIQELAAEEAQARRDGLGVSANADGKTIRTNSNRQLKALQQAAQQREVEEAASEDELVLIYSFINSRNTISSLPGPYHNAMNTPKAFTLKFDSVIQEEDIHMFPTVPSNSRYTFPPKGVLKGVPPRSAGVQQHPIGLAGAKSAGNVPQSQDKSSGSSTGAWNGAADIKASRSSSFDDSGAKSSSINGKRAAEAIMVAADKGSGTSGYEQGGNVENEVLSHDRVGEMYRSGGNGSDDGGDGGSRVMSNDDYDQPVVDSIPLRANRAPEDTPDDQTEGPALEAEVFGEDPDDLLSMSGAGSLLESKSVVSAAGLSQSIGNRTTVSTNSAGNNNDLYSFVGISAPSAVAEAKLADAPPPNGHGGAHKGSGSALRVPAPRNNNQDISGSAAAALSAEDRLRSLMEDMQRQSYCNTNTPQQTTTQSQLPSGYVDAGSTGGPSLYDLAHMTSGNATASSSSTANVQLFVPSSQAPPKDSNNSISNRVKEGKGPGLDPLSAFDVQTGHQPPSRSIGNNSMAGGGSAGAVRARHDVNILSSDGASRSAASGASTNIYNSSRNRARQAWSSSDPSPSAAGQSRYGSANTSSSGRQSPSNTREQQSQRGLSSSGSVTSVGSERGSVGSTVGSGAASGSKVYRHGSPSPHSLRSTGSSRMSNSVGSGARTSSGLYNSAGSSASSKMRSSSPMLNQSGSNTPQPPQPSRYASPSAFGSRAPAHGPASGPSPRFPSPAERGVVYHRSGYKPPDRSGGSSGASVTSQGSANGERSSYRERGGDNGSVSSSHAAVDLYANSGSTPSRYGSGSARSAANAPSRTSNSRNGMYTSPLRGSSSSIGSQGGDGSTAPNSSSRRFASPSQAGSNRATSSYTSKRYSTPTPQSNQHLDYGGRGDDASLGSNTSNNYRPSSATRGGSRSNTPSKAWKF